VHHPIINYELVRQELRLNAELATGRRGRPTDGKARRFRRRRP
jgi:hypothetical protein